MGLCVSRPEDKYSSPACAAKEGGHAVAKDTAAAADAGKQHADVHAAIPLPVKASPTQAVPAPAPCMPCGLKIAEAVCPGDELIGNIIDPVNGPAAGLPYKVHYLGPPRPPCEGERLATARALGRIDDPQEDPEITNILQLVSSVFGAPASLCALFDDQRVFISEQEGSVIPRGDFPWRWTLCGWSLAFKNPQILVIPDTHEDARFANNLKVTKAPHVRFYCGAPLVASNGHRLGTLCFADVKPRKFDQASCMIMNNLSELVVRQLEKGIALKAKAKDNSELANTYGQLQRAFDAFDHCVVLLDVTEEGKWRVLYCNAQLQKLTGLTREDAVGHQLQELFEEQDGNALPGAGLAQAIADNKSYRVRLARVKRPAGSGSGIAALTLAFRPASKEHLDEHVMSIGVPAFLPVKSSGSDSGAVQQKLYFMTIDTLAQGSGTSLVSVSSRMSHALSSIASSSDIEGLDVGHLLGRGTFGSVYYGSWFGTPVAVKVIESDAAKTGPLLEAVLSQQMKHPLIVSTLKYFHRTHRSGAASSVSMHDSAASGGGSGGPSRGSQDITRTPHSGGSGWHQGRVKHDPLSTIDSAAAGGVSAGDSGSNAVSGANADSTSTNGWAVIEQHPNNAPEPGDSTGFSSLHSGGPPSRLGGGGGRGSTASARGREWRQTWLVMEYADRGSLQEALDRGWMYLDRSDVTRGPNVAAVLATAAEISSALSYLHAQQVVHGDLSGWNIMLCSSGASAASGGRGFVAKVGDFGLSRSLEISNEIMTKNYGTLTHQPPETLTHGIVSRATDVYSFGVLLWQMYTGSRPWSGLSHAQVIMQVGNQGARLKWPSNTPTALRKLGESCMHPDASQRPTMDEVAAEVARLQTELLGGPDGQGPELTTEVEWV